MINTQAAGDAEKRLLERLVNSQERLADCNLFGDPCRRDLGEAADDYRRALHACASMPAGTTRNQRRMALLYRLALALSLPCESTRRRTGPRVLPRSLRTAERGQDSLRRSQRHARLDCRGRRGSVRRKRRLGPRG